MGLLKGKKQELEIKKVNMKYHYAGKGQEIVFTLNGVNTAQIKGKEEVLDEIVLKDNLDNIASLLESGSTKYINVPKEVIIHYEKKDECSVGESAKEQEENVSNEKLFHVDESNVLLKDVYLEEKSRQSIENALLMVHQREKLFDEWGLKDLFSNGRGVILNFYGKPGTGKSHAAKAIATELGKKCLIVSYADLESKYVGETPKNIKSIFETARKENAVIVFDEADSFLGKRLENVTASADYGVNITRSVMLIELEKFEGVVIFTTNLLGNYDEAFRRRILANIEFNLPDLSGREQLWKLCMSKTLPVGMITPGELAKRFEGITGADIKDMILFASLNCLREQREELTMDDFEKAYKNIQSRYVETTGASEPKIVEIEELSEEEYRQEMEREKSLC